MPGQPELTAAPEGIAAQPAKAGGKGDRKAAWVSPEERSKQGVAPTPACEELLPMVQELLFTQDEIEQTAARILGYEQGTIGLAYRRVPAPAAEAFLKFIKKQLPQET